jgi:predicted O-methyltransferase YrrM
MRDVAGGLSRAEVRALRHDPVRPDPPVVWKENYLDWLGWAVPGHVNPANLYCFELVARHLAGADRRLADLPWLEIGSFAGLSTNQLAHFRRKHGLSCTLFTCDKWEFEGGPHGRPIDASGVMHEEYSAFIKDAYMRGARLFSRDALPHTIEAFSDEFFRSWRAGEDRVDVFGRRVRLGGPLSFVFIDGNHSYEFAKRDFENTDEFLEVGGMVLFDDSADGSKTHQGKDWEVCEVIEEVKATGRYEVVIQNPNYLFVKVG